MITTMKKSENIEGCKEVFFKDFPDPRGRYSSETQEELRELGMSDFKQLSESLSCKGTMRGLHFQIPPYSQAKLVRCLSGKILDIVVDPITGKYDLFDLSYEKRNWVYVPKNCLHGFLACEDNSVLEYIVDNKYKPSYESGVAYDDKDINIPWAELMKEYDIEELIISKKDQERASLKTVRPFFINAPKKFLITGANGQLGSQLVKELHNMGHNNILALGKDQMNIVDRDRVFELVQAYQPDVIFHCAAWTQVDQAELDKNKEMVRAINVEGTKNLVDAAQSIDAKMLYVSTDYVYDGTKDKSEVYYETDEVNPQSEYGRTKCEGEDAVRKYPKHYIARTSWVIGIGGNNFVDSIIKLSSSNDEIPVVDDQRGTPTYTVDLAKTLIEMSFTDKYKTYHVNNEGYCSWADVAEFVLKVIGSKSKIKRITTEDYGKQFYERYGFEQAYRPRNSQLSKDQLVNSGFERLQPWEKAIEQYIQEVIDTNKMVLLQHPVKKKK